MTKKQAERYHWLLNAMENHGITKEETDKLLRCERTLHRWAEAECNGDIQRDDNGKPFLYFGRNHELKHKTSDRETAALKRAQTIAEAHSLKIYHQGDPRGCALYIIRPGDIPEGKTAGSCYNRGIAICID